MTERLTDSDLLKLVRPLTDHQEDVLRDIMREKETTEPSELVEIIKSESSVNPATSSTLARRLHSLENLEEENYEDG